MSQDIVGLITSLKNLLNENNTNTSSYYISSSITTQVQQVLIGVDGSAEQIPIINNMYPSIILELKNKKEEFAELGRTSRRQTTIDIDIISIVHYGIGETNLSGLSGQGRQKSDLECIQLTQNIENLIRNKITLSETVDSCIIKNVDYGIKFYNDTYNSVSKISHEIQDLIN